MNEHTIALLYNYTRATDLLSLITFFLLVSSNSSTAHKSCPSDDWKLHGGKCYWVAEHKKSWNESKNDCAMKNSHLMVIQDLIDTVRYETEIITSPTITMHFLCYKFENFCKMFFRNLIVINYKILVEWMIELHGYLRPLFGKGSEEFIWNYTPKLFFTRDPPTAYQIPS